MNIPEGDSIRSSLRSMLRGEEAMREQQRQQRVVEERFEDNERATRQVQLGLTEHAEQSSAEIADTSERDKASTQRKMFRLIDA